MTSRPLLCAVALALAGAAPASAGALGWGGTVGAQYMRDDAWTVEGRTAAPHLDLNLGLSLDGFVLRPGVLSYALSGEYRRATESRTGAEESVRDHLQYRGLATLFGDPRTPLAVSLHGYRTTEQSERTASNPVGLDVEANGFGVDARYHQMARPSLAASYSWSESRSHVPLLPDATRMTHAIGVSTAHGGAGFSYSAAYHTTLSEGTYATDEFDDHRVTVFAKASVTDRTDLRLSDSYFLRVPKEASPFSPRQELNSVNAVLSRTEGKSFDQVRYGHSRGVQVAEGTPDVDRSAQLLGYAVQRVLPDPEWRVRGNLDATLSQNRVGTTEHRDAGQSLGLTLAWSRNLPAAGLVEVRGGPSVGLVEPDGAGVEWGYGGTAGAAYRRTVRATTYETGYEVGYASDIGDLGTSLRQQAQGSATSALGLGSIRGQLSVSAQRRDSPRVGAAAHRSAALAGSYSWRRYSVSADVGVSSGVSSPVTNAGVGDGLFLSLPYDTHTYFGSVGTSAGLTERLSTSLGARFMSASLPDRPDLSEAEGRGSIRYAIGSLSLQLEDRYSISRVPGGTTRRNVLFVSVNRSFGSRY